MALERGRLGRLLLLAALVTVAAVVGAVAGGLAMWIKLDDDTPPVTAEQVMGLRQLPDSSYSYVVSNGEIHVYDIERSHTLVKKITIPDRFEMFGVPRSRRACTLEAAVRELLG